MFRLRFFRIELTVERFKAGQTVGAEAGHGPSHLFNCFSLARSAFGVEFVSITYQPFQQGLRHVAA